MTFCADGIVFVQDEVFVQSPRSALVRGSKVVECVEWFDLLLFKRPDLNGHGAAWAIESAIADLVGVHRPMTPTEARQSGALMRGKELKNKPALNPAGRTPKDPRFA